MEQVALMSNVPTTCPHCGASVNSKAIECQSCGIVFRKLARVQQTERVLSAAREKKTREEEVKGAQRKSKWGPLVQFLYTLTFMSVIFILVGFPNFGTDAGRAYAVGVLFLSSLVGFGLRKASNW